MSINTNELRIFADKLAVEVDQQYIHAAASELDATRTERNLLRQSLTASEARAEAAEASFVKHIEAKSYEMSSAHLDECARILTRRIEDKLWNPQ